MGLESTASNLENQLMAQNAPAGLVPPATIAAKKTRRWAEIRHGNEHRLLSRPVKVATAGL